MSAECDCYPTGFSPVTYDGVKPDCPVHGMGDTTKVAELLDYANSIDPGLRAAELSFGRAREKHEAIARHYIAYGVRHALSELGLTS